MSHRYLFELLLEEIPSWMIPARLDALRQGVEKVLADFAGEASSAVVRTGATSRRIWMSLENLPGRQPDREEEVKGPSAKAAWDADGNPTKALEGFLRKNQATADQVTRRDDYAWLRRTVTGREMKDVLAAEIPRLVEGLHWPKTMRWGAGERAYIRPAHGVVSLLDGQPLPITVLGIESGASTTGHRILGRKSVTVKTFDDYASSLRSARVVVDADERVRQLHARAAELAREVGGVPADDASIWDQWKFLTEWPGLVRAEFAPSFLSIPAEVLIMVMRVHQKQLPIWKGDKLTNSYLAVMDQVDDPDGYIASGNAFVTNARFADAAFFHDTDRKVPLASRIEDLRRLQFQAELGNYFDKTERIAAIAAAIAADLGEPEEAIVEAARLAKADLVTEMVKEFTELQGKIGGIYAREEGRPDAVWMAVYDHYLPVNVEDDLPRTRGGAIVSLADKLDTLAGFFRVGLRPTGSKDPFALRRAAQGAMQILLSRDSWSVEVPLERLVTIALTVHGAAGDASTSSDLMEFFAERVRTLMEHERYGGYLYDEIAAAMAAGWSGSLLDLRDRLEALRSVRSSPGFLSILDSAKRIANITGDEGHRAVDPALLEHPTEKRLAELSALVGEQIDELVALRDYRSALDSFASMAPELEKFFVDVLVMVDDENVRRNRIALLNRVGGAVRRVADVTKIVVARRDYNAR